MDTRTDAPPQRRLIRMPDVVRMTGLSRSTVERLTRCDPGFPKKVNLSSSTARNAPIAFVQSEVLAWIDQRIKEREVVT